jgi:hypothetical protein
MRKYATTVDNDIQEWRNMPQQWIIIYRNEEMLWHISSFLYIIIDCCGIFPHSCILLSTVVAYFLIPVYYCPLLRHISSFLFIIIHCCGIFPHSCISLSTVVAYFLIPVNNIQEWGNMPQQWMIIYSNEEICHNSGW